MVVRLVTASTSSSPTDLLRAARPDVQARTAQAITALYAEGQALPPADLHALAADVAAWQGNGRLHAWHLAQGANPALLAGDLSDPRLRAIRQHVDLLALSPALVTQQDHQALAEVGLRPDEVVLISQLVAFESYLGRAVTAYLALAGEHSEQVPAPERQAPAHGRAPSDSPVTVTGRRRPTGFTRDVLEWEPWVRTPAAEELTDEQRASFASKATANSVYFRLISLTPALTAARSDLDNAIFLHREEDGLPKAERELGAAVASKVNDCIYCASVHARKAAGFSHRPDDIDQLLSVTLTRDEDWVARDTAPLAGGQDERWAALIHAAARLSQVRPTFSPDDVSALQDVGLTHTQIGDLVDATAFFAWANRLMLTLGEPSLPDLRN